MKKQVVIIAFLAAALSLAGCTKGGIFQPNSSHSGTSASSSSSEGKGNNAAHAASRTPPGAYVRTNTNSAFHTLQRPQ